MAANTIASKIFNLKKGEERIVLLLTAYSFFMGLAYAYFYTASTSLFIGKFEITVLPYAYMGQGVVSYFVWLLYKRLQRYISFSSLFIGGGIFLLLSVGILAIGYIHSQSKAYAFALFVWYNIFLLLNGIGFWGIAAKIFNLEQAKRLFGLIGSGEILARVISFLSVPFLLKVIKTDELFYLSMGGLVVCLVIMPIITNILSDKINSKVNILTDEDNKRADKPTASVFNNKYFALIFILALFPLFATFYVDFIFLGQVKIQFVNATVISGFISIFMGSMSVAEFILRTFVSGRLLTKYGVLFSMLMLPGLLAFSTLLAAASGTIYGTVGLFFSFIILSRLFVRVVRTLFFDPSFQILYQPIPVESRLSLQSSVEGVSKSIGFIFAGAMLLLLAKAKFIDVVVYNYIFLVIIAVWLWISFKLNKEYRDLLKSVIANLTGSGKGNNSRKGITFSSYSAMTDVNNEPKTRLALNILENVVPEVSSLLLLRLLPKSAPSLQKIILEKLEKRKLTIAIPVIDSFLKDRTPVGAAVFSGTLNYLNDVQKTKFETVATLSKSANVNDRIAMANLMAHYPNYNSYKIVTDLLQDKDAPVRNAALTAAGNIKNRELWPYLVKDLTEDETVYAATKAIQRVGEPLLVELAAILNKPDVPKELQLSVIRAIADIDGIAAVRLLKRHLGIVGPDVRNYILSALFERQYQFPLSEHQLIKEYIETEIDTIVWIAASIQDMEDFGGSADLVESLESELKSKTAFAFKLLAMIYDAKMISFFINNFENATQESKAYAMEVLDMTVSADIKQLILPLLNDQSYAELLIAYQASFIQQQLPVKERLIDIINKDFSKLSLWTKAMAIDLLATFPDVDDIFIAQMLHKTKAYSQRVLWGMYRRNPDFLNKITQRFALADRLRINETIAYFSEVNIKCFLITDIVNKLKHNPFFTHITELELMPLCEHAKQIYLDAGTSQSFDGPEELEAAYVVLKGQINMRDSAGTKLLNEGQIYWYVQSGPSVNLILNAITDTVVLQIGSGTLNGLLSGSLLRIKTMINVLSSEFADKVL